jgi:hypothetical protein
MVPGAGAGAVELEAGVVVIGALTLAGTAGTEPAGIVAGVVLLAEVAGIAEKLPVGTVADVVVLLAEVAGTGETVVGATMVLLL